MIKAFESLNTKLKLHNLVGFLSAYYDVACFRDYFFTTKTFLQILFCNSVLMIERLNYHGI